MTASAGSRIYRGQPGPLLERFLGGPSQLLSGSIGASLGIFEKKLVICVATLSLRDRMFERDVLIMRHIPKENIFSRRFIRSYRVTVYCRVEVL